MRPCVRPYKLGNLGELDGVDQHHPYAIILAAGSGSRMANATSGEAKQFLPFEGRPLYLSSALTFCRVARLRGIIFVFPEERIKEESARIASLNRSPGIPYKIVAGGPRRQDSVRLALKALPRGVSHVLVHDAARPFVSPSLINRILDALYAGSAGVIPGLAVTDTIKIIDKNKIITTPDRNKLRAVQSPQGFKTDILIRAHAMAETEGLSVTDDAALLEHMNIPVELIDGEAANVKITLPCDLAMLHKTAPNPLPRSGFGYDVHRYVANNTPKARPLRLGGVLIKGAPCVQAHSDGDVLFHALADALLSLCAAGDIGQLFSDNDPAFDNLDSAIIVEEVLGRVQDKGIRLVFADLTIIAQTPKIAPYSREICKNIARLLRIDPDRVNLKATTEEGLGFTGEKKGLKAVALISALEDICLHQEQ